MLQSNVKQRTSDSVGWAWTLNLMSWTFCPVATALEASWMRSAACSPKMCTPRISPESFLRESQIRLHQDHSAVVKIRPE